MFENSKYIWISEKSPDLYGEFYAPLNLKFKNAKICLSCVGDYTLFINGKYVSSNQYGDFEHYKIYDEIDISKHTCVGLNHIGILVHYYGKDSQRYKNYEPGLIFQIESKGSVVLSSDENVLSRKSVSYKSGDCKEISSQLGFSYSYDATKEDLWAVGKGEHFEKSVHVSKNSMFFKRPIEKHQLKKLIQGKIISNTNNTHFLVDLGKEYTGLLSFELNAISDTDINIAYGESLESDGHVRKVIGGRNFSIDYKAKNGFNEFTHYMLRFACRYLEISTHTPVFFNYIGIIPQVYPVKRTKAPVLSSLDEKIYDICVNTLELCMLEHYVDCPWREQCLYAFDSRNQMLCGYYAFENGNFEYARANLVLMSKDRRSDGIMSICYPCGVDLTIPSFSLYYILAVKEYIYYSNDTSILDEVKDKILEIIHTFLGKIKNGLILKHKGRNHWNFYDWSEFSEGSLFSSGSESPDLVINALTIIALNSYKEICSFANLQFEFSRELDLIKNAARENFYDSERKLFFMEGGVGYTVLCNSLAILAGLCSKEESEFICKSIADCELVPCSLSMNAFKYDALLITNTEKYANFVLDEIRSNYSKMLDFGSTTVWETIDGSCAFDNAGSLCHGWSAIPIYYFNKLL